MESTIVIYITRDGEKVPVAWYIQSEREVNNG